MPLAVQEDPSYSSVAFENPGRFPPASKAAVEVPAPAPPYLAVFNVGVAVQDVPLYASDKFLIVPPGFVSPAKAKAAV